MKRYSIHGTAAVLAVLLALTFTVGCGGGGGSSPGGPAADIRGYISSTWGISADPPPGGNLGSVLVEGELEADTTVDRASVTVTKETRIYSELGGNRAEVKFDDLAVGQRVEVVFTGPVMESYPVQATAGEITVLENSGIGKAREGLEEKVMSIPGVVGNGISSRQGLPRIRRLSGERLARTQIHDSARFRRVRGRHRGYRADRDASGVVTSVLHCCKAWKLAAFQAALV